MTIAGALSIDKLYSITSVFNTRRALLSSKIPPAMLPELGGTSWLGERRPSAPSASVHSILTAKADTLSWAP